MTTITTGSPKQITWAEKIKSQVMADTERYLTGQLERLPETARQQNEQQIAAILGWLRGQTDARWWIDNGRTPDGHIGGEPQVRHLMRQAVLALSH
jgi:hypothetical protein